MVTRFNRSQRLAWYYTSGTLLVSVRGSYMHEKGVGVMIESADPEKKWGEKLGIKNAPGPDRAFPQITFSTYTGWGGAYWGGDDGGNFNLTGDVTKIRGRHTIKGGFFFARDRWDGYGQQRPNGSFNFSNLATGIPNDTSGSTGNAFAAFLLGYASGAGYDARSSIRTSMCGSISTNSTKAFRRTHSTTCGATPPVTTPSCVVPGPWAKALPWPEIYRSVSA